NGHLVEFKPKYNYNPTHYVPEYVMASENNRYIWNVKDIISTEDFALEPIQYQRFKNVVSGDLAGFSLNKKYAYIVIHNKEIVIWDLNTGKIQDRISISGSISEIRFEKEGENILFLMNSETLSVVIYELETRKTTKVPKFTFTD